VVAAAVLGGDALRAAVELALTASHVPAMYFIMAKVADSTARELLRSFESVERPLKGCPA